MIQLKELTCKDGIAVYELLKTIDERENSFTNPVKAMSYSEYKVWLYEQAQWSKGINLPSGFVAQTIYWLYDGDVPVGIGKIRHGLTTASKEVGGNIGYAIGLAYRGKGYGSMLLSLLINEAHRAEIQEILLTVDKGNFPSKRICEKNGGKLIRETAERWYYSF